jgi:hypothetical protein
MEVVRHLLRSSPRLQCYLPCDGRVGSRLFARAFIRDFSATGCQLRIPLDAFIDLEESAGDDDPFAGDDDPLIGDDDPLVGASAPDIAGAGNPELAGAGDPDVPGAGNPKLAKAGDSVLAEDGGEPHEAGELVDLEQPGPADEKRLTLHLHLPGEAEMRVAEGDVLEWQSLPRYHVVRVKFDEPQLDVFEQLSLYTTQLT